MTLWNSYVKKAFFYQRYCKKYSGFWNEQQRSSGRRNSKLELLVTHWLYACQCSSRARSLWTKCLVVKEIQICPLEGSLKLLQCNRRLFRNVEQLQKLGHTRKIACFRQAYYLAKSGIFTCACEFSAWASFSDLLHVWPKQRRRLRTCLWKIKSFQLVTLRI